MNRHPYTPHGPGFQFIDHLTILEPGKKVKTKKWLDPQLSFFKDHFPGEPLMPAVLMIEAAAQAAGAVWGSMLDESAAPERYIVARILQFSFKEPVYPNQTLEIEATLDRNFGTLGQFSVQIFVANEIVAQGVVVMSRVLKQ
ncbi:MAG: hotdog domain-containing protein [Verrucomicrobiota bacterium]